MLESRSNALRVLDWLYPALSMRVFWPVSLIYFLDGGMTPSEVGIATAAWLVTMALTNVPSAYVADRTSTHHLMLRVGTLLIAGGYAGMAISPPGFPAAFMCCCALGLGSGLAYGVNDAYARLKTGSSEHAASSQLYEQGSARRNCRSSTSQGAVLFLLLVCTLAWPKLAPQVACITQACLAGVALALSFRLPRINRPRKAVKAHTFRSAGLSKIWPLLAFGAIAGAIDNLMGTIGPFKYQEMGLNASWVLAISGLWWLGAGFFARLAMAYERWLGPRLALMGLMVIASITLLTMALAPGIWSLLAFIGLAALVGWRAPVMSVRIMHDAPMPATAMSIQLSGLLVITAIFSWGSGWIVERYSVSTACLVISAALLPIGFVTGWKARKSERGW